MRTPLLNQLRLELTLSVPKGARLLVADNTPARIDGQNVTVPVRTNKQLYLPGSSLKGVLRSRAEFIANVLTQHPPGSCHLFAPAFGPEKPYDHALDYGRMSCDKRFNIRILAGDCSTAERYKDACPACRLFGHSHYRGRLSLTDFLLVNNTPNRTTKLPGVVIDRVSGGAAEKKLFQQEFQTMSTFRGLLTIDNFSLWQVGWLGMLLADLQDGLLRVGHKTTSGGGQLTIATANLRLRVLRGTPMEDGCVSGVDDLLDTATRSAYGYGAVAPAVVPTVHWQQNGLWQEAALGSGSVFWAATRPFAAAFLRDFTFDQDHMSIGALQRMLQPQLDAPQPDAHTL